MNPIIYRAHVRGLLFQASAGSETEAQLAIYRQALASELPSCDSKPLTVGEITPRRSR